MANFYLDISAVGNEYQAYADTPTTWGTPQDGNGKAQSASSAAVAIATIDCASAACTGTGTIGLFGVTVSSTLNASGSALATAIAAAINASATAVTSTYSALLLPLNKLVYARVNTGVNTQVQIMQRIAGADWNAMVPTQVNMSPVVTMGAFAGGVDGPFGYYMNDSTIFGKTAGTYGQFVQKSAGVAEPSALDLINVRTKRAGANLTQTFTTNVDIITVFVTQHNFLYDNGVVWSGDSGVFVFYYNSVTPGAQRFLYLPAGAHVCGTPNNFIFRYLCSSTASLSIGFPISSTEGCSFDGAIFEEYTGLPSVSNGMQFVGGAVVFDNSWLKFQYNRQFIVTPSGYAFAMRFNRCKYSVANQSAKWTGFIKIGVSGGGNGDGYIEFRGGEFDSLNAFPADSPVTGTPAAGNVRVIFDSVRNLDFSVAGFTPSFRYGGFVFMYTSPNENREFRYETGTFILDWQAGASYPTLNSVLPSGASWSQRLLWQPAGSFSRPVFPIKSSLYYRGTTAIKTLEMEMLIPTEFTVTKSEISMQVRYQDSTGVIRDETTREPWSMKLLGTSSALSASALAWTGLPGGYTAKKLALTTTYQVMVNTEISITIMLSGAPVSQKVLYFNPELQVS